VGLITKSAQKEGEKMPPLLPQAETAAPYALLCAYAEDIFERLVQQKARSTLNPTFPLGPPPYPPASDWTIIGYLTGVDTLPRGIPISDIPTFGEDVYYGLVLSSKSAPQQTAIIIRGTDDLLEWFEDAEVTPEKIAGGALVESGFYALFKRMAFADLSGNSSELLSGLALALKSVEAKSAVVAGHSLGAALATHLALNLALSPLNDVAVNSYLFASPRVGDTTFAKFFELEVANYVGYSFDLDLVPKVPPIGYVPLPNVQEFTAAQAQAQIKTSILNPSAAHHAVCYAAMLDYTAVPDWQALPFIDMSCCACILGPNNT
jgi:hypothetical protein